MSTNELTETYAAAYFGTTFYEAERLFTSNCGGLKPTATATEVARHIERFVAKREQEGN